MAVTTGIWGKMAPFDLLAFGHMGLSIRDTCSVKGESRISCNTQRASRPAIIERACQHFQPGDRPTGKEWQQNGYEANPSADKGSVHHSHQPHRDAPFQLCGGTRLCHDVLDHVKHCAQPLVKVSTGHTQKVQMQHNGILHQVQRCKCKDTYACSIPRTTGACDHVDLRNKRYL